MCILEDTYTAHAISGYVEVMTGRGGKSIYIDRYTRACVRVVRVVQGAAQHVRLGPATASSMVRLLPCL